MLEPISKHNTTAKVQNNYPLKSYKEKNKHLIMINDSIDTNIDNNIIIIAMKNFNQLKMVDCCWYCVAVQSPS